MCVHLLRKKLQQVSNFISLETTEVSVIIASNCFCDIEENTFQVMISFEELVYFVQTQIVQCKIKKLLIFIVGHFTEYSI